mmetsp:Transcript_17412/g.39318  ORF Transcript_17412/g.39318 Transcript_17412/m.39318 type:complete len:119 (-) Transcript_17412:428-784(-)
MARPQVLGSTRVYLELDQFATEIEKLIALNSALFLICSPVGCIIFFGCFAGLSLDLFFVFRMMMLGDTIVFFAIWMYLEFGRTSVNIKTLFLVVLVTFIKFNFVTISFEAKFMVIVSV